MFSKSSLNDATDGTKATMHEEGPSDFQYDAIQYSVNCRGCSPLHVATKPMCDDSQTEFVAVVDPNKH